MNVGTNTEVSRSDVTDEIEERTLEPVRYRSGHVSKGVEQGVQYSEEDLIIPESTYQETITHTTYLLSNIPAFY